MWVDNEGINAEVGTEHKKTKSIAKSTSDDFSVEALDTSTEIVSAEIEDESKEHKATGREDEIQLADELKETQVGADYEDVPVLSAVPQKDSLYTSNLYENLKELRVIGKKVMMLGMKKKNWHMQF